MSSNYSQSRTPSWAEIIQAAIGISLAEIFKISVGIVQSYNEDKKEADVLPAVSKPYVNRDGTEGMDKLEMLSGVRVIFPGGGGFGFRWPLKKGDNVILLFCDNSIDAYSASAGNVQIDPVDLRTHDISDVIALPGYLTDSQVIPTDSNTKGKLAMGSLDSEKYITVGTDGEVDINNNFKVKANGQVDVNNGNFTVDP